MYDTPTTKRIFTLTLRVGEILLANGATTAQIEETMREVASLYGLPPRCCHPNVVFTFLSLSFDHPELEYPLTSLRQVKKRGVNYSHIMAVFAIIKRKLAPEAALHQLDALEQEPITLGLFTTVLCWAAACAASNLLLGGNLREICACFLIVIPAQFCRLKIANSTVPGPIGDMCAAALVTVLALVVLKTHLVMQTDLVIASSLFGVLPGSAIVLSAQDLITGDLLSSAARGLEAFLTGAVVAAGVGLAISMGATLGLATTTLPHAQTVAWGWLWQILAAFIASMVFARATTIPRFATIAAGLIGASGWLISLLLASKTTGTVPFAATFLAALIVGCLSRLGSLIQRAPIGIYTIPGIFPLLPGLIVYRGMLTIAHGESMAGLVLLVQAMAIGGVIAMGIAFSGIFEPSLEHLYHRLRKSKRC